MVHNTLKALAAFAVITFIFSYSRLCEHEPNVTPVFAISILSGFYLKSRVSYLIPFAGMFISNCFLGHYNLLMGFFIYGSFLIAVYFGRSSKKIGSVYLKTFLCSFIFFATTNFAVWLGSSWYEQSLAGLIECYFMAIPFFKNSLISDVCYTFIIGSFLEHAKSAGVVLMANTSAFQAEVQSSSLCTRT